MLKSMLAKIESKVYGGLRETRPQIQLRYVVNSLCLVKYDEFQELISLILQFTQDKISIKGVSIIWNI